MYNKYFFGRIAGIFLVLFSLTLNTQLIAATGDDTDINERLIDAQDASNTYDDTLYFLIEIFGDISSASTYTDTTRSTFFNTLSQLFKDRISKKYDLVADKKNIEFWELRTLFEQAKDSILFTSATQKTKLTAYYKIISLEEGVFTFVSEPDFAKQLTKLGIILGFAADIAQSGEFLDANIPTIFFSNIEQVFNTRPKRASGTLLTKTQLTTLTSQLETLSNSAPTNLGLLQKALTSVLLTTKPKEDVTFNKIPVINAEKAILQEFLRLEYIFDATTNTSTITRLANSTRLVELGKILAENSTKTSLDADYESRLFQTLEKAYTARAITMTEIESLITLFTNWSADTVPLLTAAHKTTIKTWIDTLTKERDLARLNAVIAAVDNKVTITEIKATRPQEMNSILAARKGSTLDTTYEQKVFDALKKAFETRATNIATTAELKSMFEATLKPLFIAWRNVNLLTAAHNEEINKWIASITKEIEALELPNITNIEIIITKIDPPTDYILPLAPPFLRDTIFAALKRLFDNRDKTSPAETRILNLKKLADTETVNGLFQRWAKKHDDGLAASLTCFTAAQRTDLGTWIAKIKGEIWALGITPSTFPPGAGFTLPLDDDSKDILFAELKKLFENRDKKNESALTTLLNYFKKWDDLRDSAGKPVFRTVAVAPDTKSQTEQLKIWITIISIEIMLLPIETESVDNKIIKLGAGSGNLLTYLITENISLIDYNEVQDRIYILLTNLYDIRTTTITSKTDADKITFLTSLKTLLTNWRDSVHLNTSRKNTLGVWIKTITLEILQLGTTPTTKDFENPDDWKPLVEPQQTYVFELLKRIYDARNRESIAALTLLVNPDKEDTAIDAGLFQRWAKSGQLRIDHTATITTVWIPTIKLEISLLKKVIDIKLPIEIKNWETVPPVTPPPFVQDKIFEKLKEMYDKRNPLDKISLEPLKATLTSWSISYLLQEEQKKIIIDIWIKTIDGELALLARTGTIITLEGYTNIDILITELDSFLTKNDGNPLGEYESRIFALLQKIYDYSIILKNRTYTRLVNVHTLLVRWSDAKTKDGSTTLLTTEHVATIKTIWIPNIIKIANTVGLLGLITTANKQTDYATRIAHLKKIIADGINAQVFEDSVKMSYFDSLQQTFAKRQQTIEMLNTLRDLLATSILPTRVLETDITSADIIGFTTIRPGETTATAIKVTESNILSATDKERVKEEMIKVIDIEKQSLAINAEIEAAKAQPVYADKLNALNTIITKYGNMTVGVITQNLFLSAIMVVFNAREKTSEASLGALIAFLKATLPSTLQAETQKNIIRTNLIPVVELELRTLIVENHIRALGTIEYTARVGEANNTLPYNMRKLMAEYKSDTFAATTQNLFATEIQKAFNARKEYGLTTLGFLRDVISEAITTPLLAPAQQAYAKAMFDTVNIEFAINTIIREPNYGTKIIKLLSIVKTYKTAQLADQNVKILFFDALKIIFGQRNDEYIRMGITESYEGASIDTDYIDSLGLLLDQAAESSLLIPQQKVATEAFTDMFLTELSIIDALPLTDAALQLELADNIMFIASESDAVYDNVTLRLAEILIKRIRKVNPNEATLYPLLKNAVASPLLSLEYKNELAKYLGGKGIAVTIRAIDSNLQTALTTGGIQDKILAIKNFSAGKTSIISSQSQEALIAFISQTLGTLDPTSSTYKDNATQYRSDVTELINLLNQLKNSNALSADQKKLITETYLPQIQPPAVTTTPVTVTTVLQITPILPPITTLPVDPSIPTIKAAITQPTASAQIEALSILIDNATGKAIDPSMQTLLDTSIKGLIKNKDTYNAATVTQLLQLAQKAQNSQLVSYEYQPEIQAAIPVLTATVTQKFEPTIKNITDIINISDPVARLNALTILLDNTNDQTIAAAMQKEIAQETATRVKKGVSQEKAVQEATAAIQQKYQATQQSTAAAIEKLVTESKGLDAASQNKLLSLFTKVQGSPLVSTTTQTKTLETYAPTVSTQVDKITKPTVQAVYQAAAQPTVNAQVEALSYLIDKIGGQPIDTATQTELARVIENITKAGPAMDPATQQKVLGLITKAKTLNLLTPAQIAQMEDETEDPAKPSTKPVNILKNTVAKTKSAPSVSIKPTSTDIDNLANDIVSTTPTKSLSTQLDEIASILNNAKGESFDTTTQKKFNDLITKMVNKKDSMSASEIEKLEIILENAKATPLLTTTQQKDMATKKTAISTTAKPPTVSDVFKAVQPGQTTSEQLSALSKLITNAKGKGGQIDEQTRAAFADTIKQLTANPTSLDTGTLKQLSELLGQDGITDLLPSAQQAEITQTIKASVDTALGNASQPTYENIQRIKIQDDPKTQLKGLKEIVDKTAAGQVFDSTTQEEIANAITQLLSQKNRLSASEQKELTTLLDAAKNKNLITSDQRTALAQELPTVSGDQRAPTVATVKQAATGDAKTQAKNLSKLIDNAQGQTVDAETQAAFTTAARELTTSSINSKDPLAISKVLATVKKSSGSALISSTTELEKELIDALQPSKTIVGKASSLKSPKDQLAALQSIIDATYEGTTINNETEQAMVSAIEKLISKKSSLSTAEIKQLKTLIKSKNLISAENQSKLLAKVTSTTKPASAKPPSAKPSAAKPSTAQSAAIAVTPTVTTIQKAATGDTKTQASNLSKLIDAAQGQTITPETKAAFATAIETLTQTSIRSNDPLAISKVLATVKKSSGSALISSTTDIEKELIDALQPSTLIVRNASGLSYPKDQLAALKAIVDATYEGTTISDETEAAMVSAIEKLISKQSSLSAAERTQLSALIQSKKLISAENQSKLLAKITTTTTTTTTQPTAATAPTANAVKKAATGSAKQQASNLSAILDGARGKSVDAQTIDEFSKASETLTTNAISEQDPVALSKTLDMIKKAAGNLLIPQEKQAALKKQLEEALQPSQALLQKTKTISSAKEQFAALGAITSAAVITETAFNEETKKAYKEAFQQLANKKGSLSATERKDLEIMLNTAETKGLLKAEDKEALLKLITTTATAAPSTTKQTTPYVRPETRKTTTATPATKKQTRGSTYTGKEREVAAGRKKTKATK